MISKGISPGTISRSRTRPGGRLDASAVHAHLDARRAGRARRRRRRTRTSSGSAKRMPSPARRRALARHVVAAEHDVLRRADDRASRRGRQDVVRRHHQHARFDLRLDRERHVDRHLVAVEVGVERRAHQRVELDRLAVDQHAARRPACRAGAASARGSASPGARWITSARMSQTSGRSFSTIFFAALMVVT